MLPEDWAETTIGEVAAVIGGGTPSTAEPTFWGSDVVWLTPTEVVANEGRVIHASHRMLSEVGLRASSATLLPKGSVLLTTRATIGATALAGVPLATNQGFQSLVPTERALAQFLMYWCQAHRREFVARAGGNTFKEISRANVRSMPLLLPPVAEQRRIVDLLDAVDAAIDAARQQQEAVAEARKALLADVMRPREGWVETTLGDCARFINGRAYRKWEERTEGTPVLRIQNLHGGDRWFFTDLSLPPDKYCDSGDLLFAWSASFGPYLWNGPKVVYHYHIWKVLPLADTEKRFLYYLLGHLTDRIKEESHGVTMMHITKEKIEAWRVALPSLSEQQRIVGLLDAVDAAGGTARDHISALMETRSNLLTDLLSGDHRIPDSYERLLEAV